MSGSDDEIAPLVDTELRLTQLSAEVLHSGQPSLKLTQLSLEVLRSVATGTPPVVVSKRPVIFCAT